MEDNKEGRLAAKKSGVLYHGICSDDWTEELSRQACMNMGFGLVFLYAYLTLTARRSTLDVKI